jgi:hypothetical protein
MAEDEDKVPNDLNDELQEEKPMTRMRTAYVPMDVNDSQGDVSQAAPDSGEPKASKEEQEEATAEEPDVRPSTTDVVAAADSPEVNVGSQDAAASPIGESSKKRVGGQKNMSLLGSTFSSRPATREGQKSVNSADGTKSRAIVDRYAYEVREADRNRKLGYLPMQKQIDYTPASFDIARDLYAVLQDVSQSMSDAQLADKVPALTDATENSIVKTTSGRQDWDAILGCDAVQKRLQFLQHNSRTGIHQERYGEEGNYDGEFLHGMRHGKGKYEFRDEVYDGEWKWDHRHGSGELKCADGTIIKGDWQKGKLNGFATVVDQKGTVMYEGEFKDGKRHGLGRQLFESGDMYDGGWKQGRLHDRGVYYFTNGDRLYGMWREGIYDGIGMFHYADGSISRREYRDGLLMSVQDYEHATQRFGKTLTRSGMQKHTRDREFPKEVFLLNSV